MKLFGKRFEVENSMLRAKLEKVLGTGYNGNVDRVSAAVEPVLPGLTEASQLVLTNLLNAPDAVVKLDRTGLHAFSVSKSIYTGPLTVSMYANQPG